MRPEALPPSRSFLWSAPFAPLFCVILSLFTLQTVSAHDGLSFADAVETNEVVVTGMHRATTSDFRTSVTSFRTPDGGVAFLLRFIGGIGINPGSDITKFDRFGRRQWKHHTGRVLSTAAPRANGGMLAMNAESLFVLDAAGRLTLTTNFPIQYGPGWSDYESQRLAESEAGAIFAAGLLSADWPSRASKNLIVQKYAPAEGFVWARDYGPVEGAPREIHPTLDGGCLIIGNSSSMNTWGLRLNGQGEVAWKKVWDVNASVTSLANGRWLLGYTASAPLPNFETPSRGGTDFWLLIVDDLGRSISNISLGGTSNDWFHHFLMNGEGEIFAVGQTTSGPGGTKRSPAPESGSGSWLVKLEEDFSVAWDTTFPDPGSVTLEVDGSIRQVRFDHSFPDARMRVAHVTDAEEIVRPSETIFKLPSESEPPQTPVVSARGFVQVLVALGWHYILSVAPRLEVQTEGAPGTHWTRIPAPGEQMHKVAFGKGKFVAAGKTGIIAASDDGVNWSQTARLDASLNDIGYGLGRYVAVGAGGALFVSENTTNWLQIPQPATNSFFRVYGDRTSIVLAGESDPPSSRGLIVATRDGINWTTISAEAATPTSLTRSPESYLAVGNKVGLSTNLSAWTFFTPALSEAVWDDVRWKDVAHGNGVFVSVGHCPCGPSTGMLTGEHAWLRAVAVSGDGKSWAYRGVKSHPGPTDPLIYGSYQAVTFGMGHFIAVGSWIGRSKDGHSWEQHVMPDRAHSIAYGPGMFVIAGTTNFYVSGELHRSPYVPRESIQFREDGSFGFSVETERGARITLYASEDLRSWRTVTNNPGVSGSTPIFLNPSPASKTFYRISAE